MRESCSCVMGRAAFGVSCGLPVLCDVSCLMCVTCTLWSVRAHTAGKLVESCSLVSVSCVRGRARGPPCAAGCWCCCVLAGCVAGAWPWGAGRRRRISRMGAPGIRCHTHAPKNYATVQADSRINKDSTHVPSSPHATSIKCTRARARACVVHNTGLRAHRSSVYTRPLRSLLNIPARSPRLTA